MRTPYNVSRTHAVLFLKILVGGTESLSGERILRSGPARLHKSCSVYYGEPIFSTSPFPPPAEKKHFTKYDNFIYHSLTAFFQPKLQLGIFAKNRRRFFAVRIMFNILKFGCEFYSFKLIIDIPLFFFFSGKQKAEVIVIVYHKKPLSVNWLPCQYKRSPSLYINYYLSSQNKHLSVIVIQCQQKQLSVNGKHYLPLHQKQLFFKIRHYLLCHSNLSLKPLPIMSLLIMYL